MGESVVAFVPQPDDQVSNIWWFSRRWWWWVVVVMGNGGDGYWGVIGDDEGDDGDIDGCESNAW
jgi:hypothetical protein